MKGTDRQGDRQTKRTIERLTDSLSQRGGQEEMDIERDRETKKMCSGERKKNIKR